MNDNQPYVYALTFPVPDVPGTVATLEFTTWERRACFLRGLTQGPVAAFARRRLFIPQNIYPTLKLI